MTVARSFNPLIGRKPEIETLDQALRATISGAGHCILLRGEAGIGKSRLAAELMQRAAGANCLILRGFCAEQDITYPYGPWIDALRSYLATKGPAEVRQIIGIYAPELVKLLPELAMSIPSVQATPSLDPNAEKHRLFEILSRFIESLAGNHPLVILLEDLHWCDEQSLEFLHILLRRIGAIPVLILGTYREEISSPRLKQLLTRLKRTPLVEEITLSPLSPGEVEQMMQSILSLESPPRREWLDLLMSLAEGNPYYVEEIIKGLMQLNEQPGQWDATQLPSTIRQTILSRVEDLHSRSRGVLNFAAVIGERFDFNLLQELTALEDQALIKSLRELIEAQLIAEQSADQFAFRHALTREVVYSSLLHRQRRRMHKKIGETLEQLAIMHGEESTSLLAYHFYQAGEWSKTIAYAQRAGEQAQAVYASREALAHFSHAIEAAYALGLPIPLSILRGRGQALSVVGEFEAARKDYEALIERARQAGDRFTEWQALIDLGYAWQPHDLEKAGVYFQQALQLARTLEDGLLIGQSLNRLGNWYFFRSEPRQAILLHQEALKIFEELADQRGIGDTLQHLGAASYGTGDVIQGVAYYERAIPILHAVDDRQGLVRALEFLSMRARFDTEVLGNVVLTDLARSSEQAYDIALSFDWREGEGEALSRAAICWIRIGEYGRALELLRRAQILGEEISHQHLLTSVNLILGELYLSILALEDARQHLELAFSLAQQVGAMQLFKSVQPLLVDCCIQQGDLPRAQAVLVGLSLAENLAEINKAGFYERLGWSARAELELGLGNSAWAIEILDSLIKSAHNIDEFGLHAIPWLSRLRAQALVDLGRLEEAEAELTGALATTRARGELTLLWRLHADLGKVLRKSGNRKGAGQQFSYARQIAQGLAENIPAGALRENFFRHLPAIIPPENTLTPRQAAKVEFGGLTTREREIAALIARGKSNKQIAVELFISEKTVERHVANIMGKLGFNARTKIAAWAVSKGLNQ